MAIASAATVKVDRRRPVGAPPVEEPVDDTPVIIRSETNLKEDGSYGYK